MLLTILAFPTAHSLVNSTYWLREVICVVLLAAIITLLAFQQIWAGLPAFRRANIVVLSKPQSAYNFLSSSLKAVSSSISSSSKSDGSSYS